MSGERRILDLIPRVRCRVEELLTELVVEECALRAEGTGDAAAWEKSAVATAQLGLAMTSGDGRVEGEMRKVLVAEMMADPMACAKGREIGGAVLDVLRRVTGGS